MGKYFLFGLILAPLFSGSTADAGTLKPLVFTGDKDYPPLLFLDKGVPKGIYVDIIQAMDFAGQPVEIRLQEWETAQLEVMNHTADIAIGVSISPERGNRFDFTLPVMAYEFAIFVRRGNIVIRNLKDLKHRQVGVTAGGLPRRVLEKDESLKLILIADYLEGFRFLRDGLIDAVVADKWVAAYTIHQHNVDGIVPATGAAVFERQGAFGVRKGNHELLAAINAQLSKLRATGKLDEILASWSPHEMVYITRERAQKLIYISVSVILGALLVSLSLWIFSLRRHMRKLQQAEKKIHENEERFQKLTRYVPGMMYQFKMDAAGRFSLPYVSDAVKKISELDPAEARADFSLIANQIYAEDAEKFRSSVLESARALTPWRLEYRSILPKQGLRWRLGESQPEKLANGEILWHGYLADITERKLSEIRIQELSAKIIDLREKERAEISRELHDSIGQNLVLLKLRLQSQAGNAGPEVSRLLSDFLEPVDRAISTTREISRRLSPLHLKTVGLAGAVQDICDQILKSKDLVILVDIEPFARQIPEALNIQAYRIIQEALTNIIKHSLADRVEIVAEEKNDRITLRIRDNGRNTAEARNTLPGIGLQIMHERARLLGADFHFEITETGATVSLTVRKTA